MPNEANQRAEALLLSTLNEEQREEYQRLRRFHVETESRIYRIQYGRAGNVKVVHDKDADFHLEALCLHPTEMVPNPDTMLAQKLLLEADEAEFREIANISYFGAGGIAGVRLDLDERNNIVEQYLATPDGRARLAASFTHPLRLRYEYARARLNDLQEVSRWTTPRYAAMAGVIEALVGFLSMNLHDEVRDVIESIEWPEGMCPPTFEELFPDCLPNQVFDDLFEWLEALVSESRDGPLTPNDNPRRLLIGFNNQEGTLALSISVHTLREFSADHNAIPEWARPFLFQQREQLAITAHQIAIERAS